MVKSEKLKRWEELNRIITKNNKDMKCIWEEERKLKDEVAEEENKKFIGKCFKSRNSYNSEDSWWIYYKIVGVLDDRVRIISVEKTEYKKIEIEESDCIAHIITNNTEIPKSEFNRIFKKYIGEINDKIRL